MRTTEDMRDAGNDEPVISVTTTQSLQNWMQNARKQLTEQEGDARWQHVSFYDLRRSWATSLVSRDVDPLIVCDWGGWSGLDTFIHSKHSVENQKKPTGCDDGQ